MNTPQLGLVKGQWLIDQQGQTWRLLDIVQHESLFNPKQKSYSAIISSSKRKIHIELNELQTKFSPVMSPMIGKVLELERTYLKSTDELL